ncbi:hypothetical protein [Planctomyces sp. SH-PL14]|uniref:hypothetical protein n=1 Tax=Planctomyces sp. SH-PL14 TaxID=1632864 RepID=UPI0012E8C067|nr:hypothetical protein [Planctomyces sp. SH-PL14]
MAGLARGEILVVWEDDDIYLPWHVSSHVRALSTASLSKPSRVRSLYTGSLREEPASGRFHGSIAFTRAAFELAGGWPITRRGDFDIQFLKRLDSLGQTVDPCKLSTPSYVFRWGSTQSYHGQAFMAGPRDPTWYDRCEAQGHDLQGASFTPNFDEETRGILNQVHGETLVAANDSLLQPLDDRIVKNLNSVDP